MKTFKVKVSVALWIKAKDEEEAERLLSEMYYTFEYRTRDALIEETEIFEWEIIPVKS